MSHEALIVGSGSRGTPMASRMSSGRATAVAIALSSPLLWPLRPPAPSPLPSPSLCADPQVVDVTRETIRIEIDAGYKLCVLRPARARCGWGALVAALRPTPSHRRKHLPITAPFSAAIVLKLCWDAVPGGGDILPSGPLPTAPHPRICHHEDWWGGKHLLDPTAGDGFIGTLAKGRRAIGGAMQATFVKVTGGEKALAGDGGSGVSGAAGTAGSGTSRASVRRQPFMLEAADDVPSGGGGEAVASGGASGIDAKLRGHGDPLLGAMAAQATGGGGGLDNVQG